jgi:hypothetical protein
MPTEPRHLFRFLPKRDPTRNTLFQIQKFSAGEISKNMQRVFWAGRSAGLPAQAAGLGSHFLLEMGSNFVVKLSQIRTF